ncbi:hypothetical protein [Tenacibaculum ovolyticum]|uniref:hypothetical protein n=1 Tax=Tenacibaculum ovolyticum TaxID=104270 RepID=UPI001F44AC1B|nr:hypothetical protein [Tenacibaculum ovolyticum]
MIYLKLLFINPFENLITSFDIFIVSSLFSLIGYLKYIETPKEKKELSNPNLEFDMPIYQSKDILLQEYKVQSEYAPTGQTTSVWVKTIVYILVLLVAITPLFELFGI